MCTIIYKIFTLDHGSLDIFTGDVLIGRRKNRIFMTFHPRKTLFPCGGSISTSTMKRPTSTQMSSKRGKRMRSFCTACFGKLSDGEETLCAATCCAHPITPYRVGGKNPQPHQRSEDARSYRDRVKRVLKQTDRTTEAVTHILGVLVHLTLSRNAAQHATDRALGLTGSSGALLKTFGRCAKYITKFESFFGNISLLDLEARYSANFTNLMKWGGDVEDLCSDFKSQLLEHLERLDDARQEEDIDGTGDSMLRSPSTGSLTSSLGEPAKTVMDVANEFEKARGRSTEHTDNMQFSFTPTTGCPTTASRQFSFTPPPPTRIDEGVVYDQTAYDSRMQAQGWRDNTNRTESVLKFVNWLNPNMSLGEYLAANETQLANKFRGEPTDNFGQAGQVNFAPTAPAYADAYADADANEWVDDVLKLWHPEPNPINEPIPLGNLD